MSATRVTQRTLNSRVERNLQRNIAALGKIQDQMSSGKQISKPSDSPTGTVSALRLRSEIRRNEQYKRNADDGMGWLGTADNTLTDALDTMRRVRDLTLQGVNASTSVTDRSAMAAEVQQLREHLISLGNTKYLDQPLFGGTANVTEAYDASGNYQGNAGVIDRTVGSGVSVAVSIPGSTVFGPAGNDVFKVLDDIQQHLTTNTAALTTTDLTNLDQSFLKIQDSLALVGARYHQVEAMGTRADNANLDATTRLSEVESIDLPKTVMDLQLQQVAYQAALGAASRVLQPSLVDFLH